MKKVTLVSFFRSYNIGDLLIADTVSNIFENNFDCEFCDTGFNIVDIKKFRENKIAPPAYEVKKAKSLKQKLISLPLIGSVLKNFRSHIVKLPKKAYNVCKGSDAVIFAGGNSLMDLEKMAAEMIVNYRVVKKLKKHGIKVYYCFCGVGPFNSKGARKYAKKLINALDFISVRDKGSFDLVKELAPKKQVELWSDSVLTWDCPKKANKKENNAIGVNVYFGDKKERHEKVLRAFTEFIKILRERYPERKIKLFSSELTDIEHVNAVKGNFTSDNEVEAVNISNADELFNLFDSVDLILGVRMHTIITSMLFGLASTTIAWQNKVKSLAERFDNEYYNFTIDEFIENPALVADRFFECYINSQSIAEKNRVKLNEIKSETNEILNSFLSKVQ